MLAGCATCDRPLPIADLPDLLPAVLEPVYDQVLPAWFGGDPVVLPEQMPRGLPVAAARELAAASAPERPVRAGRGTPAAGSQPATAGDPVMLDEAGLARLLGFLAQVVDRRGLRGRRYPLSYLLALPMLAMPAGHLDPAAVGEWVADAPDSLLLALGAPTRRDGRPRRPDTKTITEALPTLTITERTATLDGHTGTALGIDANDEQQEIIINPADGTFIGERTRLTADRDGIPAGTIVNSNSVQYGIATHPGQAPDHPR